MAQFSFPGAPGAFRVTEFVRFSAKVSESIDRPALTFEPTVLSARETVRDAMPVL